MTEFRASGGAPGAVLARVILQCYYRDDRVLRSLGIELRAPFPKGHVLPDGDWSILDPVKARGGSLRRARVPGREFSGTPPIPSSQERENTLLTMRAGARACTCTPTAGVTI